MSQSPHQLRAWAKCVVRETVTFILISPKEGVSVSNGEHVINLQRLAIYKYICRLSFDYFILDIFNDNI